MGPRTRYEASDSIITVVTGDHHSEVVPQLVSRIYASRRLAHHYDRRFRFDVVPLLARLANHCADVKDDPYTHQDPNCSVCNDPGNTDIAKLGKRGSLATC